MKRAYFLHTGYGKTKLMLDKIMNMSVRPRVLLISTKNIVETSWPEEIKKWYSNTTLSYDYITGDVPVKKREKIINRHQDILALSTSMLDWYTNKIGAKELKYRYDMVIIDESSLFKNYRAKRFKLLKTWVPSIKDVFILSATPTPQSIEDIWSQIYLLDGGQRLGKNITAFRDRFAIAQPMYNGLTRYEYTDKATGFILDLIQDITTSVTDPKEKLFPDPITKKILIKPDPATSEILAQFKADYIVPQLGMMVDNKTQLITKISQIASGQVYNNGTICVINDIKFKALQKILSTITTPVLIFYHYIFDKEKLLGLDDAELLDTPEQFKRWNNNEIKIGILSPFSAAHGLNLQYSECKDVIWYSPIWDTEKWIQANARVCRRGQTRQVYIRVLLLKESFDEYAFNLVQEKFITEYKILKSLE